MKVVNIYEDYLLRSYIGRGLLIKSNHSTLPLSIYNYSRICQFEKVWDNVTLSMRGMVLDNNGRVIARPIPKFFNFEECTNLPKESYEVHEKMDGSLGIVFYYNGEWQLASRGSFESEQAKKGKELLKKYPLDKLERGVTYLFEIIYKENRIVCDYGSFEGLVLLTGINTYTGEEIDIRIPQYIDNFDITKRIHILENLPDLNEIKKCIPEDQEGYVIKYKSGFRVKVKGAKYVELHKLFFSVSTVAIWEMLSSKKPLEDYIKDLPDELDTWVRDVIEDLKKRYLAIEEFAKVIYSTLLITLPSSENLTKKAFAECIKGQYGKPYESILFSMFDGKDYESIIWRYLKPEYKKPFEKME